MSTKNTNTKPYQSVNLQQAADMVAAVGDKVTCLFQGEMGIGKSAMLRMLAEKFPNHLPIYLEAQTYDVGDLQMPKFKTLDGMDVVAFAPNETLGLHLDKPGILMVDEIGKCMKSVLNAMLRLLLERKLGAHELPAGSLLFATTNLALEGLGDAIPPHARNRMCQMKVRKPTALEWIENYALRTGVHPIVIGTAMEFPQMFESFETCESPENNQYIFDPRSPRVAFVTPRSMEKASDILHATDHLPDDVITHALMGTVGEAAAMDMLTIKRLDDDLPVWERIVSDPENAKLPKGGAAGCMLVAKAIGRVELETFDAWMTYMGRMSTEAQALFAKSVMRSPKKAVAATNRAFTEWAVAKTYLFV